MSRGAEHCGVSQSAATQHVQEVERRLGVILLNRSKRPLELTHAKRTGERDLFPDGGRPRWLIAQRPEEESDGR